MQVTIFSLFISSFFLLNANNLLATDLPKVFLLGEHEKEYEQLVMDYNANLLAACDNDMQGAFKKWVSMLKEMEEYAKNMEYDINGVKFWIHVFWDKNGEIKHLAYHLRPNSRSIETEELSNFLQSFINQYRFPLTTTKKFSHYSTAYFPMTTQRMQKN
ncbi:MAG: hypothetical protein AB8G22_14895 [Saprospiraceae bacterium]